MFSSWALRLCRSHDAVGLIHEHLQSGVGSLQNQGLSLCLDRERLHGRTERGRYAGQNQEHHGYDQDDNQSDSLARFPKSHNSPQRTIRDYSEEAK